MQALDEAVTYMKEVGRSSKPIATSFDSCIIDVGWNNAGRRSCRVRLSHKGRPRSYSSWTEVSLFPFYDVLTPNE